jgi:pectin methylesterase-like acyl-CoA thioesterase
MIALAARKLIQLVYFWSPLPVLPWITGRGGNATACGAKLCMCSFLALSASAIGAPTLFPADGASNVCPDTPLEITFDSPPQLSKSGNIAVADTTSGAAIATIDTSSGPATQPVGGVPNFRYLPVLITGDTAAIYVPNHALDYNKTYAVTVDANVFNAQSAPITWKFTTKSAAPATGTTKLTIAADGSGDFCTVQGAVDFIPDGNTTPTTLFIRKGIYSGLVCIVNKNALTFTGEDRKQTVIEYANNARFNPAADQGVYHRGVFLARNCNDLTLSNLTIRDTTPRGGSQAEAIILNGSPNAHATLTDVDLYSFQDTLQINSQAYLSDCYIEGDVDFMWGSGPSFFENCHCYGTRSKGYYTQIRNTAANHGYVFHHCTLDGPPGITGMFLSRIDPSRFAHSEVVLIDCVLGKSVGAAGWLLNKSNNAPDVHFWEYNSQDADGNPIDVTHRLAASRQLSLPGDAETIGHYSDPAWVLGGWNPVQTRPANQ